MLLLYNDMIINVIRLVGAVVVHHHLQTVGHGMATDTFRIKLLHNDTLSRYWKRSWLYRNMIINTIGCHVVANLHLLKREGGVSVRFTRIRSLNRPYT